MNVAHPAERNQKQRENVMSEHLPKVFPFVVDELHNGELPIESHRAHVKPPNVGRYFLEMVTKVWLQFKFANFIEIGLRGVGSRKRNPKCSIKMFCPKARRVRSRSWTRKTCISSCFRKTSPVSLACLVTDASATTVQCRARSGQAASTASRAKTTAKSHKRFGFGKKWVKPILPSTFWFCDKQLPAAGLAAVEHPWLTWFRATFPADGSKI